MLKAVKANFKKCDILIMAAAVSDFTPKHPSRQKIKKGKKLVVELKPAPDILSSVSASKGRRKIIGFSLDTEDTLQSAKKKLKHKKCDLVIANTPASLAKDSTAISVIQKNGKVFQFDNTSKAEAAKTIIDFIIKL
jgi:phosphopantothenoylcysteine decarboxylase/phosphopantothenate--cysteine ligase